MSAEVKEGTIPSCQWFIMCIVELGRGIRLSWWVLSAQRSQSSSKRLQGTALALIEVGRLDLGIRIAQAVGYRVGDHGPDRGVVPGGDTSAICYAQFGLLARQTFMAGYRLPSK